MSASGRQQPSPFGLRRAGIRGSAGRLIPAPASSGRSSGLAAAPAPVDGVGARSRKSAGRNRRWRGWRQASIFALGGDQADLDGEAAVGERRNSHAEAVADLQRLDSLAQSKWIHKSLRSISVTSGTPGETYSRPHVALVDCEATGASTTSESMIDWTGRDVGDRLLHVRHRDRTFLGRVALTAAS